MQVVKPIFLENELGRLQMADVDLTERIIGVREGKGGKDGLALFTDDLGQQFRLHLKRRSRGSVTRTFESPT